MKKSEIILYSTMAVVLFSQIGAYLLIKSLEKRVRNIDLSEKMGESADEYAKKCVKV